MPEGSISSKVIGGFTKASASNAKAHDGDHNRLKLEQRAQTFLQSMHTVPDQAPSITKSCRDFPDSEVEDASLNRTSFRISEMDMDMSSVDDIGSESGAHSEDESFALDEEEEPMPRYIVHPQSTNKVVWDVFVSVLIFYSVINIPFRIGFGVDSEGFAYGFDWFVDGMFGFDIILSFFTAYWHNDELETSRGRIVVHYLRGWFLIDLVSTLPFDHIVAAVMHSDDASDVNSSLRSIKLIKFFRLVRLIKLVRLLKLKKFGSSLEGAFSLNPALQRLLKLLLQIIFICHLLACFWYFTSTLDDSSDDNWVMAHGLSSDSIPTQYLASFYWTVATMMAVGYGDIHAVNDMERMYSIFVQVVGATCFGFIIANISAFLETFDPRASAYRSRMDRLKQYMRDRDLPRKLQRRVRKYYDYVLSKESIFDDANILAQLPSHLTETVILHIHGHKARTINFLKYEDSSFVAYIMARSKVLLALSGEVICEQDSVGTDIFMVLKGKVEAIVLEIDETEHKRFRINQDEEENALMRKGAERINSTSGTLRINAPALSSDADAGREVPPTLTGSTGNSSSRLEPPRPRDVRNMVKQQLGASSRNMVQKGIAFGKKVKHAVVTGLYNRGSNFGEVGVLRNKPHEVTFRANQTCDLLSISKEHMEYAIYMYPTSALRFRKRCDKHAELLEKSIASSTEYFPHSDRHVKTLVTVDARMHQSAATVERRIGRMVLSNMIAYDITGRFQSQAQRGRKKKKNRARTLGLRTSSALSESHPDKSHHVAVKTSIKVRRALVNQKSRAGSLLFKTPEVTEELAILGSGATSTSKVFPMSDATSRTESLSALDSGVPFDAPSTTTIMPTSRSVTRSRSRSRYIVDAKPDTGSGPMSLLPSLLNPALEKKTQGARSHVAWGFRTARSAASDASSSTAMSTARQLLPHQLRRKAKNSEDGLESSKKRPCAISTDKYDDNAATKKPELFSPGANSESGSGGDNDSSRADQTNSSEAHSGQPVSTAGVHKLSDMPARSNTGLMVSRVAGKICEDVEMDLDSVLGELWIVPPGHGLKVKWDLLIAFFIVYSVLLVPFRIGFAQSSEGFSKAFDILVDIFFGLDMIVAFRTGFESSDQDVVIVVPLAIAKQYLKGWFLVDFMSTFPFDAVLAALLASADEEALRSFKLIKIFRMIRLLKLIRLFKLRKILGELDSEIELSSGFTKLISLFLQITFVAHLFACFWFFAASSEDDIRERWYVRLGFSPDDDQDVSSKYISSLYWSFTTMTTVGYGDISPTSDPERIYAIFIMIMGATIFGYVVGSIANLISQLDIADALYKAKMNELDEYLSEQGIPRDLRRECKSCYAYSLSLKSVFDERALLSALSPSLRQEIIITIHQAAVDAIPLFRDQTATFTADLIQVMHPQLALPGTFIVRHNSIGGMIYFIVNGEVLVYEDTWPHPDEQGRVDFERAKLFRHRNGNFFGHQAVLSGKRHEITAKCTKLTQLYILSKAAIGELVDSVPPFALLLQSALRSAIRRQDMAFGKLQRGRAGNKTSKLWSLVQNHFNDILNMSPNKFKRMSVEANSCTKLEELIGRIVGVNLDTRVGEPGGADSFSATVRKIREAKRNGGFDVSSSSSIADLPSAEVSTEMQALPATGGWKFKASQVEKKVDKRASDASVSDTSLWETSEPGVATPAKSTSVLFDTAANPDDDTSNAQPTKGE